MEKSAQQVPGVVCASLNFATGVLVLDYDPANDPRDAVLAVVRAAGHGVEPLPTAGSEAEPPIAPPSWLQAHLHEASLAASAVLIVVGYLVELAHLAGAGAYAAPACFVLAALAGGVLTGRRALASLRARSLDMNVLMAVAVIGAAALGDFAEAATVIFLFSIGQYLEARALTRTRRSIRDLIDLTPARARVRRDGVEVEVAPEGAVVGDLLVVRPGERIALDGTVCAGASSVDEAPITGEPVPVAKAAGDEVFAGTLNGGGLLEIEVTRIAADSTLARVVYLVEEAQASRAPAQQLVDRFTRYYTPVVVILALLVAAAPPLLHLGTFHDWIYRALVLLVVSCPCALVISTPVAIVSAITRATRDGVLVKGGAFLEAAAKIRAVAFDKTGTLTNGCPEVVGVLPVSAIESADALRIAAALESGSTHPLAAAVVRACGDCGAVLASDLRETPGRGVEGTVDGVRYGVGSPAFALGAGALGLRVESEIERLEERGESVLVLFGPDGPLALIAAADEMRPEAPEVVRALARAGVGHTVMLTGDNERTAAAIAGRVGVADHRSRLLPEDKVAAVAELRQRWGSVAMVGDGVNDAPALATADLGIAMGAAGSHTALETADVALMSPGIAALPGFFDLGRRTLANIRQNVVFSVVTKVSVLVLAVFGYAPLWLAVFADMGVSLIVTANGLRLLRRRRAAVQ